MQIWDISESIDLVIYKFSVDGMNYLAEIEISTKKLLSIMDYERYIQNLSEYTLLVGEGSYNKAYQYLKENGWIV